jgi:phosphatidylglycerophosphate synthase
MEPRYDGFVSRHLNRRISDPIARLLAKTWLTPNQASLGAGVVAGLSFASFVLGWNIVGGVLAQISSIADGVDGELARLKKMASPFGGFMDAVLDRYADALIILGMTIWAAGHEAYRGIWIVGFLAMVGTLCISYTRAKAPDAHRNPFDRGIASAASRDVRLFLIMLGGILGQVYIFLMILAALTNLTVLNRLIFTYLNLHSKKA